MVSVIAQPTLASTAVAGVSARSPVRTKKTSSRVGRRNPISSTAMAAWSRHWIVAVS